MSSLQFSGIVQKYMESEGVSLRALARECGLDSSFLSKILSGKRNPPSEEKIIDKISSVIGVDPDYLMFSCGRIPSKWQNLFLRKDISSILNHVKNFKNLSRHKHQTQSETARKIYTEPDLPDEIL